MSPVKESIREPVNDPHSIVMNQLVSRSQLIDRLSDPRRNIEQECGHPDNESLTAEFYQELFDRNEIAAKVVELLPRETWQVQPTVFEKEESDITEFENAWDALSRQLMGDDNFYQDEAGSLIWEYLLRADILSGIGQYGIILLGFDDGKTLDLPLVPKQGMQLLYVRCFPEYLATISAFDIDPTSPRFGQPSEYSIQFTDPRQSSVSLGLAMTSTTVHWTRVVHIADNLLSSEVFGTPRQKPVVNRILDLKKLYGSSAEMYWQGALPGLSIETLPQLGGDVRINEANLKRMMEDHRNGLQRDLLLKGMSAKMLAPTVVDPRGQIEIQIEAICIKLGIPIRVFKGSERGELASSQDDAAWNDRLRHRQKYYVTPRIIRPFVNRLIWAGCLPKPSGFSVWWPDLTSQTGSEKASIAVSMTTAISSYVQSGAETVMPLMDFYTRILGLDESEAQAIIDSAAASVEDDTPETGSPLLKLVGGITGVLDMFDKFKAGAISEETLKQLLILFYGVSEERAVAIIADGLPTPPTPALPPVPPGLRQGRLAAQQPGTVPANPVPQIPVAPQAP